MLSSKLNSGYLKLGMYAALLRQVMGLTPQQIEMLPEAQRQQVLDLQRQLVSDYTQLHLDYAWKI